MKRKTFLTSTVAALLSLSGLALYATSPALAQENPRPPSVPLVAHDPYFSVWSPSDTLTDSDTRHWTGKPHTLTSLVRVDGKAYRLMGRDPSSVPEMKQTNVQVLPTRTIYTFDGAGVQVMLTFTSPLLPDDLDLLSRPVTYLTWDVRSTDGKPHEVAVYVDASAQLAVNQPEQQVIWQRLGMGNLTALRMGTEEQPVLQKRGDDLRVDWGYLYLAAGKNDGKAALGSRSACTDAFVQTGQAPAKDDARMPRPANGGVPIGGGNAASNNRAASEETPVSAFVFGLGSVGEKPVTRHAMLAYDDEYSIVFFRRKLRPYWRRNGMNAEQLLLTSARDREKIMARCRAFDNELMADLTRVGGKEYAYICALAHRQALAAQKLAADSNGQPLSFSKENFSNGCIATVDVIYPASPQLLLFSPTLMKASLVPLLEYSVSPRWKFPFAPHDLGTYPHANGQVYGGGERTEENQMPVEESGNMLIMLAALAKVEGNANFVSPYWPKITQWADYLVKAGFDPESQLSTDDFAGHLAHNVNLSAKAIEAIGAYAYLCELRGDKANAAKYRKIAQEFAARWVKEADSGTHYRLAFDKPDTWSQKYNLVWDKILGFNLFPPSVVRKEVAYYKQKINRYGLPLDNRDNYTKLDWTIWTATLTGDRADFDAMVRPVYHFLQTTPDRNPMTDWYRTTEPKQVGFQARSVVGGVFIKLLDDPATWRKWVKRDKNVAKGWAAIPAPPALTTLVPTSQTTGLVWQYTTDKPGDKWFTVGFDASSWKTGQAGFGTKGTPGAVVRTEWNTSDIWLRREFDLGNLDNRDDLQLLLHHDENAEIYINGVLATRVTGYTGDYDLFPLSPAGRTALKPGKNIIAVHVRQTTGGQYIDVGISRVKEAN